jgi:hypothetical protein
MFLLRLPMVYLVCTSDSIEIEVPNNSDPIVLNTDITLDVF